MDREVELGDPVDGDLNRAIARADRERRRRYGLVAGLVAAAAVVTLIIGTLAIRSQQPVHPSLRMIRDQGSNQDFSLMFLYDPASGLEVRRYALCDGGPCSPDLAHPPRGTPRALEVIQDGRSALFEIPDVLPWIRTGEGRRYWTAGVSVRVFDEDSVLVQDVERVGGEARFRLLQADGTSSTLRKVSDDPAPALPGPEVLVLDTLASRYGGLEQDLYVVDDRARTLRPLDVPDDQIRTWGTYSELLLGTGYDCSITLVTADGLRERELDCTDGGELSQIDDVPRWVPAGWMRRGRMAVTELVDGHRNGASNWHFFIHASLDDGATWQRIPIGNGDPGGLSDLAANALQQLGHP